MKKMKFLVVIGIALMMLIACEKNPVLLNDTGTLPVVNLTIDEKYLWSPDSGLYLIGNIYEKWEFPAVIAYVENGQEVFRHNVGFRIKGNASRENSMKSFGIYWRKEYGNSKLKYQMFPDISTAKFKRILLRNSGNDFGKTHIKDASVSSIVKKYANVEYQEYKPCVLYLNKEYWGIYNMREMITPHHFDYHYGVDDDDVDLLEGSELNPSADDGFADEFKNSVIGFIQGNDLSNNDHYTTICDRIDIESYMDYIIINTYICNTDWPVGNSKWWRERTSLDYSKWRWIVYDTDWAFKGKDNIDRIWIGDLYGNYREKERNDGFYVFNNLIKNETFRHEFLERYMFFIETVFEKKRVKHIITSNKHRIEDEYKNHQEKWNTLSVNQWEKSIDEMIEFNNERNDIMKRVIKKLQNAEN